MMGRVWKAYRAEWVKAYRRRLTFVGPALVALTVLSLALVRPIVRDGDGDYAFIAYATPMALNLLGLLLLLTYSAGLISTELGSGTVCLMLVRPLRRIEFFLAKLLLGITYAALLTGAAAAAGWLVVLGLGDLTGITLGGDLLYTGGDMMWSYLLGALLGLLPQTAAVAFALMISCMTRSTGAAVSLTVGVWAAADLAKQPLGAAPLLFSSYLETPWNVFAGRCDGLDPGWLPGAWQAAAVSLLWMALFITVAGTVLNRRDLHA